MLDLLAGKVTLITGAASGLGLETARLFAEEGARVVLSDIDDAAGEAAAAELGRDAVYVRADVRESREVNAAVAAAENAFGRLDVVVANAGILGRAALTPTEAVRDEWLLEVIDVNLLGTYRTFRAAIEPLRRAGGGALSTTSSVGAMYGVLYRAAYTASKGGVNALVRSLAVELAPDRIRVNAVCPGAMETNIVESLGRPLEEVEVPLPDPSVKGRVIRDRENAAREAAGVHLFLCSELGAYVNGACVTVDGGFSIWTGS